MKSQVLLPSEKRVVNHVQRAAGNVNNALGLDSIPVEVRKKGMRRTYLDKILKKWIGSSESPLSTPFYILGLVGKQPLFLCLEDKVHAFPFLALLNFASDEASLGELWR